MFETSSFKLILVVWRRKAFAEQTFFISFIQGFLKTLYIKLAVPHELHSLGRMSSVRPLVHQVKALRTPIIHSHISSIYFSQWNWALSGVGNERYACF